jgi:hypothetical protein
VETIILFYILLFLVAFLYSSVGHGGASGYLALMAIFSFAPDVMKPTCLIAESFCITYIIHPVLSGQTF